MGNTQLIRQHATHEMQTKYKDNFIEDGQLFLVDCASCHRENWGPMVASGQCAWCGWGQCKHSWIMGHPITGDNMQKYVCENCGGEKAQ